MRITINAPRRRLWIGQVAAALAMVLASHPVSGNPPATAAGEDLVSMARLDFQFTPVALQEPPEAGEATDLPQQPLPARFGAKGSRRVYFQGGGGYRLNETENAFGQIGVGWSFFIAEDLSLNIELYGGYFDLFDTKDAWTLGFNLLFRWHLYSETNWSFYVDGGAGVMGATNEVPRKGTNWNFTPQAGAGFSFDIADNTRMLLGVRWHHVSNGSLSSDNPGMDNIFFYAAVSMPF